MNASTAKPHVLIVDDDQRLRGLLSRFMAENGFLVSQVASADEARAAMALLAFDLLIVDVMMPGETGVEFLARLRQGAQANTPALLLTALGETHDRIAGLEAGADDYLVKPFEPRELLLRAHAILRRAQATPESPRDLVAFGAFEFDAKRGELKRQGALVPLTAGEAALLRVFTRRMGATLTRADLAREADLPESRAIDVQITRLRRKIEPDPRNPRFLQTVWGHGYVFWGEG